MEPGFKTQVVFRKGHFDAKERQCPRMRNLKNVIEAYELWGKSIYVEHAERILSRFNATAGSTCWSVVRTEHVGLRIDGVLRRTLEELKMPADPTLGVLCVSGAPRQIDSKSVMLELDLGLGAYGGHRVRYPLPNFPHTWALVKVSDEAALRRFAGMHRKGRTRGGKEYSFWADLYVNRQVGTNELSTVEAQRLMSEPRRKVVVDPGSNFQDPEQAQRTREWLDMIASGRSRQEC